MTTLHPYFHSFFQHFQTYFSYITAQANKFYNSLTAQQKKILHYASIALICIIGVLFWISVIQSVLIPLGFSQRHYNAELQRAKTILDENQLKYVTLDKGIEEGRGSEDPKGDLSRQGPNLADTREKNPCFTPKYIQIEDEVNRHNSDMDDFFTSDVDDLDNDPFFGQSSCQRIVPQQKETFFKSDKLKITVRASQRRKLFDGFRPLCLTINTMNANVDAPRLNILYHVKEMPDVEKLTIMNIHWAQIVNKRRWNDIVEFVDGAVSAGFAVRVILVKAFLWTDSLHQRNLHPNSHTTHAEHKIVKGADNVQTLKGEFNFDIQTLLYTFNEAKAMLPPQVELIPFDAQVSSQLEVDPVNDLFVAYNDWSMAFLAHQAMEDLGRSHFLFYLNKYEPGELGGGVEQAFAFEALSLPHFLITHSPELHITLKAYKQSVFEQGNTDQFFTINKKSQDSILDHPGMLSRLESRLKTTKKRRVLIHGCQDHEFDGVIFTKSDPASDRCGYYLGLQALSRAVLSGAFGDLNQWEFHTTGEEHHKGGYKAFPLTTGITIISPQELSVLREKTKNKEEFVQVDRKIYADLSSYDIVLALDISTLITNDQLEAAAAGAITIVNELDVKKGAMYKRYSNNFVTSVPGVHELSKAIEFAVTQVNDFQSRSNGSQGVEKHKSMWQRHHVENLQRSVKDLLQCKWRHSPLQ